MKRSLCLILALALVLCLLAFPQGILALSAPVGTVTGESSRTYETLTLSDGTDTGVRYTEMNLSGTYGSGKVLRLAECDLSDTNLSIDVINCGDYTVSRTTVSSAAKSFSKNGKTVLCALNGDLWMTGVNSNSNVTKKTLQTTRGVMIIDREVWATQEFGMENYQNTSGAGTAASLKSAFGVTDSNQPLVGAPVFTLNVKNETTGTSLVADGLNRLPAWDSLVVYNHRINSLNYALNDSCEVVLTTADSAFTVDGRVTARVTAIYPSGSTTRPTIGENTIILTARGSRMTDISSYRIGDTVSFDLSLIDEFGNTDLWQSVVDAIGGHMHVMVDDAQTLFDTRASEYPTSLIGVKDDGTVMFANINASTSGAYKGLQYRHAYQLCSELGYNSVFYLDGGGSSSIVTLKDGTYTQRNYSADGSPRAVINAVAMVWNDVPVCEKQGALSYITTSDELSSISPTFIPAGILERIVSVRNDVNSCYLVNENTFFAEPSKPTIDPFMYVSMSRFSEYIDTSRYKYITVKLRTNISQATQFSIYYFTDAQSGIQNIQTTVYPSDSDIYVTFNMATSSGWSGLLTQMRLDFFEGITSAPGQYVEIDYVAFSATPRDTAILKSGSVPLGAIKNYYAYKNCNGDHTYTLFPSVSDTSHVKECALCGITERESHTKDSGTFTPPTCIAEGSAVFSCRGCGHIMETVMTPKSDHVFSDEFTVDKEPTATEPGQSSRHCLYCDAVTDVRVLPATGIPGDVNGDGKLSAVDSNRQKRFIAGLDTATDAEFSAADLNGDGAVTATDSYLLLRMILGV